MQGMRPLFPLDQKVAYLSALMEVGLMCSMQAVLFRPRPFHRWPTGASLGGLPETETEVLAIVANERGAQDALAHGRPDLIGFPFGDLGDFQQRNTGGGIEEGWRRLEPSKMQRLASGKGVVVYLSMGFGNPYGDPWSPELAGEWAAVARRAWG